MFEVMKIFIYLETFAAVLCVVAVITLWQDCEHSEYFLHSRVTKTNGQITLCVNQLCGDPAAVCNYAAGQRRPSINISLGVSLFSINQRSFHMNTSLSLRTKSLKRCKNVPTVKNKKGDGEWLLSVFVPCCSDWREPCPGADSETPHSHSLPVQSEMASTKVRHCRAQQHWQTLCRGPAAGSRKADRCYRG